MGAALSGLLGKHSLSPLGGHFVLRRIIVILVIAIVKDRVLLVLCLGPINTA